MTEMFESVNALDPDTAAVVDHLVPPPRSQGFAIGVGVSLIALAIGFVTLWFGGLFRPQISVDGNWTGFIENLSGTSKPATVVLVVHNDGWFDSVMLGATDTAGTSMTIGDAQGETGRIELPAGESVEVTIRSTIDCSGTSGGPTLDWPRHPLVLEARAKTFPITMDIVTDTDLPLDPSFC